MRKLFPIGYDDAPRDVRRLTPQEAYAYGWNAALNATQSDVPNPEVTIALALIAAPDVAQSEDC